MMRIKTRNAANAAPGYTLIEILLSTAILGVIGGAIYLIFHTGLVLFARNTAMNLAHQQARALPLTT